MIECKYHAIHSIYERIRKGRYTYTSFCAPTRTPKRASLLFSTRNCPSVRPFIHPSIHPCKRAYIPTRVYACTQPQRDVFREHNGSVTAVSFSSDGLYLVSGSVDCSVSIRRYVPGAHVCLYASTSVHLPVCACLCACTPLLRSLLNY